MKKIKQCSSMDILLTNYMFGQIKLSNFSFSFTAIISGKTYFRCVSLMSDQYSLRYNTEAHRHLHSHMQTLIRLLRPCLTRDTNQFKPICVVVPEQHLSLVNKSLCLQQYLTVSKAKLSELTLHIIFMKSGASNLFVC